MRSSMIQTMEESDDDGTKRRARAGRPKKPLLDRLGLESDSDLTDGSRRRALGESDDDDALRRKRGRQSRAGSIGSSVAASSDDESKSVS